MGFFSMKSLTISVVLLGCIIAYLRPSPEELNPIQTSSELFSPSSSFQVKIPSRIYSKEKGYAYGKYKSPLKNISSHLDQPFYWLEKIFSQKKWHYNSITTDKYFVGLAIVQLNYVSDAFLYVVDKTSANKEKYEFQGRLPGTMGLAFSDSSVDIKKCTSFHRLLNAEHISICYEEKKRSWHISSNVTVVGASSGDSKRLFMDVFLEEDEALALVFPLGNNPMRAAYVHKGAGSKCSGKMEVGTDKVWNVSKEKCLGAIDWTKSMALRCTRWKWASSSFMGSVKTKFQDSGKDSKDEKSSIGINFSADVYDVEGHSQENAIWINGKVYLMSGVTFSIPKHPRKEPWKITSKNPTKNENVQLTFYPHGTREDHTNLILIESDFIQPFGNFKGTITLTTPAGDIKTILVEDAFGVVENHFAVW